MAMNEICELSSILHGDEDERRELQSKLVGLQSAIHEKENQLCYEIDEKRRLEKVLASADDAFHKTCIDVEMGSAIVEQISHTCGDHLVLNASENLNSLRDEQKHLLGKMETLSQNIISIENQMGHCENNSKCEVDSLLKTNQIDLDTISTSIEACINATQLLLDERRERCERRKGLKTLMEELNDERAQLSRQQDSVQGDLAAHESAVNKLQDTLEVAQIQFQKHQSEIMNNIQQQNNISGDLSAQLDKENASISSTNQKVDDVDQQYTSQVVKMNVIQEAIDTTQTAVDKQNMDKVARMETLKQLQSSLSVVKSEKEAITVLQRSHKAHSFEAKADSLQQELDQVNAEADSLRTSISEIENQMEGASLNPALSALDESLASQAQQKRALEEQQGQLYERRLARNETDFIQEKRSLCLAKDRAALLANERAQLPTTTANYEIAKTVLDDQVAALQSKQDCASLLVQIADTDTSMTQLRERTAKLTEENNMLLQSIAMLEKKAQTLTAEMSEHVRVQKKQHKAKQQQIRVKEMRDGKIACHQAKVKELRVALMTEDQNFQRAQEAMKLQHKKTMDDLEQELRGLGRMLRDKQSELREKSQQDASLATANATAAGRASTTSSGVKPATASLKRPLLDTHCREPSGVAEAVVDASGRRRSKVQRGSHQHHPSANAAAAAAAAAKNAPHVLGAPPSEATATTAAALPSPATHWVHTAGASSVASDNGSLWNMLVDTDLMNSSSNSSSRQQEHAPAPPGMWNMMLPPKAKPAGKQTKHGLAANVSGPIRSLPAVGGPSNSSSSSIRGKPVSVQQRRYGTAAAAAAAATSAAPGASTVPPSRLLASTGMVLVLAVVEAVAVDTRYDLRLLPFCPVQATAVRKASSVPTGATLILIRLPRRIVQVTEEEVQGKGRPECGEGSPMSLIRTEIRCERCNTVRTLPARSTTMFSVVPNYSMRWYQLNSGVGVKRRAMQCSPGARTVKSLH
eukprot:CAMPEP_0175038084 /NCGR_PEP_ID=MMETSP0005-20121125/24722_1 /TAXON_ID=420556 /ORGANISM="Ochromonas sp., Strain CCMP1393" /LENGTH=980 /DNA_ID=CAMNT_0016299501 /DNA_START=1051 /DNA_END=3993 /DNA_ORIENTATION=+